MSISSMPTGVIKIKFKQYKNAQDFLDKNPGMSITEAIEFLYGEIEKLDKG